MHDSLHRNLQSGNKREISMIVYVRLYVSTVQIRDMHDNLHKDLCRKVEMIERSMIDYRKIYDPPLQMKDIYMIAYFRINVPTAGERDM